MNDTREPDTDRTPAVIEPPELPTVDLTTMTLDELAAVVGHEYAEIDAAGDRVRKAVSDGLIHAIRLGEAAMEGKRRAPSGGFYKWLDGCDVPRATAVTYMRLARDKEALFEHARTEGVTLTAASALALLSQLGLPDRRSRGPEVEAEAIQMHKDGVSINEIAALLSANPDTVRKWVDPDYRRRALGYRRKSDRKRREEKLALARQKEREERAALARAAGGDLERSYNTVLRLAREVDAARSDATSGEQREALRTAYNAVTNAETAIVAALRLGRAS